MTPLRQRQQAARSGPHCASPAQPPAQPPSLLLASVLGSSACGDKPKPGGASYTSQASRVCAELPVLFDFGFELSAGIASCGTCSEPTSAIVLSVPLCRSLLSSFFRAPSLPPVQPLGAASGALRASSPPPPPAARTPDSQSRTPLRELSGDRGYVGDESGCLPPRCWPRWRLWRSQSAYISSTQMSAAHTRDGLDDAENTAVHTHHSQLVARRLAALWTSGAEQIRRGSQQRSVRQVQHTPPKLTKGTPRHVTTVTGTTQSTGLVAGALLDTGGTPVATPPTPLALPPPSPPRPRTALAGSVTVRGTS